MVKVGHFDKLLQLGLIAQALFYVFAGVNHFVMPWFYLPLIPPYLPMPEAINIVSGALEVLAGSLMLIPVTRRIGGLLVALLLLAFVPSHLYVIDLGGCITESLCVPLWVAWVRLILVHPILIAGAVLAMKWKLLTTVTQKKH